MDTSIRENIKYKKYPGTNLKHCEENKSINNRNRGRRNPYQRHRKYFQQNYTRKFPQPKVSIDVQEIYTNTE